MATRKPQPKPFELPKISGAVEVSFKSEDSMRGQEIGPVFITDKTAFAAWCKANGQDPNDAMWPFGEMPGGLTQTPWVTKAEARRIATHYGVALGES